MKRSLPKQYNSNKTFFFSFYMYFSLISKYCIYCTKKKLLKYLVSFNMEMISFIMPVNIWLQLTKRFYMHCLKTCWSPLTFFKIMFYLLFIMIHYCYCASSLIIHGDKLLVVIWPKATFRYSVHQKSGDRVKETVYFNGVWHILFFSPFTTKWCYWFLHTVKSNINGQQTCESIVKIYFTPIVSEISERKSMRQN